MTAEGQAPHGPAGGHGRGPREPGARALLQALVGEGDPDEILTLRHILADLDRRAFGMLLFVCTLPAFIPIPIGGAIAGPLVVLIGAQLLLGMHKPWLPGFIARRGPHRSAMARFHRKVSPWIERLEHLFRPRLGALIDHRLAIAATGLLLVLLGLLLSLPIPFTNFLFGGLLLAYAIALLERDGALLLLCWGASAVAITVFGLLSGNLAALAARWVDLLV